MIKTTLLFVLMLITTSTLFAQSDSYDSLANFYSDNIRTLSCGYANRLEALLGDDLDTEMVSEMNSQVDRFDSFLKEKNKILTFNEKRLVRSQRKILKSLLKDQNRSEKMKKFYDDLCKQTEGNGKAIGKGLAHASNVLNMASTFPIRFFSSFVRGLYTGEVRESRGRTFYQVAGKKMYRGVVLMLLYRAVKLLRLASSPASIPFLLAPMGDYFASIVCENPNQKNEKEIKFCQNYNAVKDRFFDGVKAGEILGSRLNNKIGIDFTQIKRGADVDNRSITDENICEVYNEAQPDRDKIKEMGDSAQMMEALINPNNYYGPQETKLETSDDLLRKMPFELQGQLKNIVISLGPSEKDYQEALSDGSFDLYKKWKKQIKRYEKLKRKLYRKSKDVEKCNQLKKESKFSWTEYNDLLQQGKNFRVASHSERSEFIMKQLKHAKSVFNLGDRLKLSWEVVFANDIDIIAKILKDPQVANVVIVSHAVINGRILDSSLNKIPYTFFSEIAPSIMSISFYSCHGENRINRYNLDEKFGATPSYHRDRSIFVTRNSSVAGKEDVAMIAGITAFVEEIDTKIYRQLKGNLLLQNLSSGNFTDYQKSNSCQLDLKGIDIEQGTVSVELNRRWVGAIRSNGQTTIEFPCDFLKTEGSDRTESVVMLKGINLLKKWKVDLVNLDPQMSHYDDLNRYRLTEIDMDPDGISIKLGFTMESTI